MPALTSIGNTMTVRSVLAESAATVKPLVSVNASMTITEVVSVLNRNNVVSAPVSDSMDNDNIFLGMVNMLDIFHYIGFDKVDEEKAAHHVVRLLQEDPDALNLWKCEASDPLATVLKAFRKGVHRVLVLDSANPEFVPVLLSQSDVIKFLNNHAELVNADESIATGLGFVAREGSDPMITVSASSTAAQAFATLAENDISAAPIVDGDNHLIGTVSATDLRGVALGTDLSLNIMDFLSARHARGSGAPVSVHADAKIGEVLIPLAYSGVHRVWVMDAKKAPVGVVSMSDVIDKVCKSANL